MHFIFKTISKETLGDKLKKTRKKKQMSLLKIEERTGIQVKYLIALETGNYHKIYGEIYLKNFLSIYAKVLNLNTEEILKLFEEEQKILLAGQRVNFNIFSKIKKKTRLLFIPNIFKKNLIRFFFIILLIYVLFEIANIISPPKLIIQNPLDNLIISESIINIKGETNINANIKINNQEISKNNNGSFNKIINLQPGLNLIKISTQKKHSREMIQYRTIIVK